LCEALALLFLLCFFIHGLSFFLTTQAIVMNPNGVNILIRPCPVYLIICGLRIVALISWIPKMGLLLSLPIFRICIYHLSGI